MEPLLVPILGLWVLLNLAPVDLASGDAVEQVVPEADGVTVLPIDEGDADADGVLNMMDACDGTPAGYPVLSNGCPSDTDGDGVSDGKDRCPATEPGTIDTDSNGCSQRDRKKDRPFRYSVGVA